MRILPAEQVERDLESLLDGIEQDGALSVQLNGANVAVILSPTTFAELSARFEAAQPPAPRPGETSE